MKRISFLKFVVFAWLASALWVHAQGQFTTFDAPGAGTSPGQGTLAAAINAAGTVSGMYWDANYVTHGFVRAAIECRILRVVVYGHAVAGNAPLTRRLRRHDQQ